MKNLSRAISAIAVMFLTLLSFNALAATSNFVVYDNNTTFVVQGKTIKASLVSNQYNCWTYASNMYKKIWGDSVAFSSDFTGTASMGHNSLRQLSDADRTLTANHLKSYISNAELGAVVRICGCTSSCSAWGNDGLNCGHKGHNVVIVQKDSNGFAAVENAYPEGQSSYAVCTRYYTWQGFVNWWGGYGCGYIKYIKWPNAPVYNSSSSSTYPPIAYERCTYKIVKDVTLRKAPFDSAEKGSYIDADDNVTVTSVAVVDNGSNYWLKLGGAYDGQYIFSGYSNTGVQNGNQYLQYVSASHGITWSGNNLSGITHTQGKSLALNGQITSNATIKSITAQLYHSGSKWGDPYTASVNSQSYSMYGSAIDMNTKFGSLSAGNCRLDLKVEYYTNRMSTATYTIQSNFTVGSGSSAAASTLKITGVKYPSTYMYNNGGYGYVVDSGTVSSNYTLTKITTDIQNSSGKSITTGLPKTVTPSGTSYSISALNSVLPFSKISSAGTYYWIITATDSSGKSVTLKMPINAVASGSNTFATGTTETTAVTGVSVDLDEVTLRAGQTTKLTATVSPSNATNKSVTWKSSNTAVATVSNGTVTAKTGGTATITCTTADGGYTASCKVTVTTSVTGISLSPTALTLEWGKTSSLTATISPTNATNKTVHWSTSNSSVATVDNGVVKGVSAGTATITAMAEDGGYKATCAVTVKISPTGVKLNTSSATLNVGNTTTLTATISPSNATNKNVTWSSSNTAVATVSGGKVTAVANGTATITCKTADGKHAAACTVVVYGEKKLVLPADLVVIDSEAFRQSAMDTVIISPNTESIGSKAFADCDDLSIIYMPDRVVQIAEDAFDGSENVCFVCESENAAATYAKKHSIPYVVE